MELLGLIGGTSWHSTIYYYREINQGVGKIIGQQANPEMLIHSINIEIMRAQDADAINSKYLEVSQGLESRGAKAIIICANTPHMAYDFVQPKIDIPILHIGEAIGLEAKRKGIKKPTLFGNRPTMTKNFIPKYLKEHFQLSTRIPEKESIDRSHQYVSEELTQGLFTDKAKQFYLSEFEKSKDAGSDGIILGCTELPMLITEDEVDMPLISSTDVHIKMAIDFIIQ